MRKNLKVTCIGIGVISLILMVISIILDISGNAGLNEGLRSQIVRHDWIEMAACAVAFIFAFIYVSKDAMKSAARYYKAYCYTVLVAEFLAMAITIYFTAVQINTSGQALMLVIIFTIWLAGFCPLLFLSFVPDLGQTVSIALAVIAALTNLIMPVGAFNFQLPVVPTLLRSFVKMLMIVLLYFLVVAKYENKMARGKAV